MLAEDGGVLVQCFDCRSRGVQPAVAARSLANAPETPRLDAPLPRTVSGLRAELLANGGVPESALMVSDLREEAYRRRVHAARVPQLLAAVRALDPERSARVNAHHPTLPVEAAELREMVMRAYTDALF